MRKSLRWILILLIIGILVAVKLIFFSKKEEKGGASKARSQGPVAVDYYVVVPSTLSNSVFATGMVGAFRQVDLIPEVSGKVTEINFTDGETVNKGTLLVKLNDQDLQAQLNRSKTQIRSAEQKL